MVRESTVREEEFSLGHTKSEMPNGHRGGATQEAVWESGEGPDQSYQRINDRVRKWRHLPSSKLCRDRKLAVGPNSGAWAFTRQAVETCLQKKPRPRDTELVEAEEMEYFKKDGVTSGVNAEMSNKRRPSFDQI